MPKKNDHSKEPQKLTTLPAKFIKSFIPDKKLFNWADKELSENGPYHKQVLSALLLEKCYQLLQKSKVESDSPFLQKGIVVEGSKEDDAFALPVLLAIDTDAKHASEIAEAVAKAPAHESLAYLLAMQAIQLSIDNMKP